MTTPEPDYRRLQEGQCPIHATVLERRELYGFCAECQFGWSMKGDEFTMHFEVSGGILSGRCRTPQGDRPMLSGIGRFTIDEAAVRRRGPNA